MDVSWIIYEGDKTEHYRCITLLDVGYKIISRIIRNKLNKVVDLKSARLLIIKYSC